MMKRTPEDEDILAASTMFRKAAYGEDEEEYTFLSVHLVVFILGIVTGVGAMGIALVIWG